MNWDAQRKDYIENFVPFVINLAAKKNYKQITAATLKSDFEAEYGLILPLAPLEVILKRTTKQGYLIRENNQYTPVAKKISSVNFGSVSQAQERKLNQIVDEFINFVKQEYDTAISAEDAGASILKFLKDEDLNIIFNIENNEDLFADPTIPKSLSERSRFFVAKFLQEIRRGNQIIFTFVNDLVTGQMLAHTILNPDIQGYLGKLRGQNFYLDIAFLFNLLGIDGEEFRGVYQELIDALKECGANLFVFRHTLDEFLKIIESDLQILTSGNIDFENAGRSLRSFILNERSPSDVEEIINMAEKKMNIMGISVVDPPSWESTSQYQIDEAELHTIITKKYQERHPLLKEGEKDYTIQKDIDSISAIERLRKNRRPNSLPTAEHTMITGNSTLAAACNIFANKNGSFAIPPCLHHLFIGTLLFLEMPTRITTLNEKRLMADAYAAMRPSEELLKRYWTLIEELKRKGNISPDDYILLRSSTVARSMLQEKTMGALNKLTEKTPKEILFDIESHAKLKAETGQKKEEAAHQATKEALARSDVETSAIKERTIDLIEKFATLTSTALYVIILIVLAIFFYYSDNAIIKIIFVVLGFFVYATGFHFWRLRNKIRLYIISTLKGWLYST